MKKLSSRTSDWGKQFKAKDLNNEIKKLDYQFKCSLLSGAFLIIISFLIAIALGYVLFAGVTLMVGTVLGGGAFLWRMAHPASQKERNHKPDNSPLITPPLATLEPLPKQHSVAKMDEIWDEIVQVPSVKKPNQIQ